MKRTSTDTAFEQGGSERVDSFAEAVHAAKMFERLNKKRAPVKKPPVGKSK